MVKLSFSASHGAEPEPSTSQPKARKQPSSSSASSSSDSEADKPSEPAVEQVPKPAGSRKRARPSTNRPASATATLLPIYEDFLPETVEPQLEAAVEKILKAYFDKTSAAGQAKTKSKKTEVSEDEEEEEEEEAEPPKKKKPKAKPKGQAKPTAERKVLTQLAKSFESLQQKLAKALKD